MRRTIITTLAIAGLLLAGCAAEAPAAQTVTATATTTATATEETTLTPEPAGTVTLPPETVVETQVQTVVETTTLPPPPPAVAFDDGTYIVGKDIEPGTYQASGSDEDCYWSREDQSGEIIDNDFSTLVTVQASDFALQTVRCGNWSRVG